MQWKKIGKRLLFPPFWLVICLIVVSAVLLTMVFLHSSQQRVIAYFAYVLAFYTLCVVTALGVEVLPKLYVKARRKVLEDPLANRLATDQVYRAKVSLSISLAINLLYAAANVLFWYLYQSWWFVCLAVYYGIMSLMRFLLVRYVRCREIGVDRRGELRRSVACSYIMLLLNVFLSGAVLMVVYQDRGYEYHGVMIYVMAMYTFYMAVHAIINLIKYRSLESPVMSTAKAISMAAALVSVLNLETAMFAEFGADMAREDQKLMIILTGAGISVTVIIMALYLIVRCTKELKNMRSNQNG